MTTILTSSSIREDVLQALKHYYQHPTFLFTSISPSKLYSFKDRKWAFGKMVHKEQLAQLIPEIAYFWFFRSCQDVELIYQSIWYEMTKDEGTVIIHVEYQLGNKPPTFHHLLEFFGRLKQDLKGFYKDSKYLDQPNPNNHLESTESLLSLFFVKCEAVRSSTQEMGYLELLQELEATPLFQKRCLLVRVYNNSLFKSIVHPDRSTPTTAVQLTQSVSDHGPSSKQVILDPPTKLTQSSPLMKSEEDERKFNNGLLLEKTLAETIYLKSCIDKYRNMCRKLHFKPKTIDLQSQSTKAPRNFAFIEMVHILQYILQTLNYWGKLKYEALDKAKGQVLCAKLVHHQNPRKIIILTINDEKEIMVRMQTGVKVYLEERDLRMYWMNLLKFDSISMGARVGISLQQERQKVPGSKDVYVILYASDMFGNDGMFLKIALMIDSLLVASTLLEPGLNEYKLSETIAQDQFQMRRQMMFLFNLFSLNYRDHQEKITLES